MVTVSVIVAAYNSEKTIAEALDSILGQTFQDWECIICDDASEDNTWQIIVNYKDKYGDKFIGIRNSENKGPAYGRNRCVELAKGEYIAIQDADDTSHPERLARQVEFLNVRKDVSAVGTYAAMVNSKGEQWGINKPHLAPREEDWMAGPQVIHASTMIRKKDLLAVGKYNENLRRVEDYDLWLRMILKGYKIETLPLTLYRIRADGTDYGRRTFKYRWEEVKAKYGFARTLRLPLIQYVYLLKPLINGIIPGKIIHRYHKHRFGKN